jgi:AraC-like DNA-binding protein
VNTPRTLSKPRAARRPVTAVEYKAPPGYSLDVELYPAAELRRRVGDADARGLERIDFHCLIYVTAGRYSHMVDFDTQRMTPGSLLLLQPGQVHRFGDLSGCEGWMLVFRAELLPSSPSSGDRRSEVDADKMRAELEPLPLADVQRTHLHLSATTQHSVIEAFERMADDARRPASRALNMLLRSQVQSLLIRLQLDGALSGADDRVEPVVLQRYRRFRATVERNFARSHGVAPYAARLGCSEKSLTRAAFLVTDRSAKAVLTERIVLEAKRLLAHTALPVAAIGDQLGFAEATNFVKFFRREAGQTPGAFRAQQRDSGTTVQGL